MIQKNSTNPNYALIQYIKSKLINNSKIKLDNYFSTILVLVVQTFFLLPLFSLSAQEDKTQEALRNKVEHLRQFKELKVGSDLIAAIRIIPHYYEKHNFKLAWTNPKTVNELLKAIDEMENDGLNPDDYHRVEILRLRKEIKASSSSTPSLLADMDILLTDALLRIVYHLIYGKVDPERLDPNWNFHQDIGDLDPVKIVQTIIDSPSLFEFIEDHKPQIRLYKVLKNGLAQYRQIKEEGGWPVVQEGSTLKVGMSDERVVLLRKRLTATNDLPGGTSEMSNIFDENIEKAVRRFQTRHGLDADGAVGKNTLKELNVTVDDRINQLLVNLERTRWVLNDIPDKFLIVNIAGFRIYFMDDFNFRWISKVQVGKPYRQTPVFRADLKYIVFNPTWTVPPTILRKDILPKVKKDPDYLRRKNIKVLDNSGKVIDQDKIDWSKYTGKNFPYILRQDPGPTNALGEVKFIYPNKHFVFLHDTPSKSLFGRDSRAFSSGCIRVENPFKLAELVLGDSVKWSSRNIDEVNKSGKTKTVYLSNPLPVLMLYWTAFPGEDDILNFRQDVYSRDGEILAGLQGEFRVKERFRIDSKE